MPSEITLKTVLCFWSICMALGRPPFPLNSGDLNFPPSGLHSHSQKLRVPPYMMQLYQTLMGEHKDPHRPENQILEESNTVQSLPAKIFPIPVQRHTEEHDSSNKNRHLHKMDYPVYMMQLYQSLIGNGTDFPGLEHPILQESDMVLSLTAKSCSEAGNLWRMSFDMSSISSSTELKLVELRVRLPSFHRARNITVEIFHSKDGQHKLFMGSFMANPSAAKGNSWKIFNLTRILQSSIHHGEPILNPEYVAAEDMTERHTESGNVREPGQVPPPNTDPLPALHFSAEKVMLVVFAREKTSASHFGSPSLIKTVQSSKYIMPERTTKMAGLRRHRRNHNSHHSIVVNSLPAKAEAGAPLCRRVDMWVEFDKIEWGNRIIYPRRYNAYRCEGTCPIPLNETFKPTNHAFLKSLVKMYDSEKVECPSCVPVKMSALSMLMYEDDNVSLKHHEDMVVEACGCN
ncbi:PREDICTED: nodal homolog 2-A-like [Nanorana parkeri]|uniref:nodal homolog 2-A-like n=1 Tax=Nanorana parkeri TaxID=125878 RepID=UPI0008540ABC|nr:PREDICTED: nodal homolog 2-A-like [Nanorana parkeri]